MNSDQKHSIGHSLLIVVIGAILTGLFGYVLSMVGDSQHRLRQESEQRRQIRDTKMLAMSEFAKRFDTATTILVNLGIRRDALRRNGPFPFGITKDQVYGEYKCLLLQYTEGPKVLSEFVLVEAAFSDAPKVIAKLKQLKPMALRLEAPSETMSAGDRMKLLDSVASELVSTIETMQQNIVGGRPEAS